MESIGQLAAGNAHEINTPIQYVGDNIRFLRDAFRDCQALLDQIPGLFDDLLAGAPPETVRARFQDACAKADLEFLAREIPAALDQSLDGVGRVARIVHAMKEFSHPDAEEKLPADLNRAIESTVTVSRNEWKYVAEVVTDLDPDLPPVPCFVGHFNQVMLNLIVNAAHAIAEKVGDGSSGKGRIRIATRRDGDWAEIRVEDDGAGIPPSLHHRIFEPFFTTKEVGKGTGQGLSTCHAIIVRKHGGRIAFESELGRGTAFIVRLPLAGDAAAPKTDAPADPLPHV
jgi:signal transduction histidine kinase